MTWHIIEGSDGCTYAKENDCVAVIVDALRASATAAMLLDSGATEILVVAEVEEAFKLSESHPDALLYGERGGLPPQGFDYGNSPRETEAAKGRPVIFTTSNGSARLHEAYGAPALYLASTVNAFALLAEVSDQKRDVVLIPAGKFSDPEYDAQEDWTAATAIAMLADAPIGEGALLYREWRYRIELDSLQKLFQTAPHAQGLQELGLRDDIAFCARSNVTTALPRAVEHRDPAILLRNAAASNDPSLGK